MTDRWLPGAGGPADATRPSLDRGATAHLGGPEAPEVEAGLPLPWGLTASAEHLRRAAPELGRLPVSARIAGLARLARSWLDPDDPHRVRALERLPAELGLSAPMVAWALDSAFGAIHPEALRAWWAREGTPTEARLSAHVWAGNVFVAGLPPVIASVLAGVPAIIKAPSAFPSFAALLARSIADHAPELGPAIAAAAWSRAEPRTTIALFAAADRCFAFGDDASIAALRSLAPCPVLGFGHRVSIALVPAGIEPSEDLLDALSRDALAYDGAGCLTPRWVLVEGDLERATAFARAAAARMPYVAQELPALPLPAGPGAARAQYIGLAGFAGHVAHGPGWLASAQPALEPAPPPRSLCFVPAPSLAAVPALLAPLGSTLQGLALAGEADPDSSARGPHGLALAPSLAALRDAGLSLCTRPGWLQRPPLDWNHDDVRLLAAFG